MEAKTECTKKLDANNTWMHTKLDADKNCFWMHIKN